MRSTMRSGLLVVAIVVVATGAWIGRDTTPDQRTPADVGAIADLDVRYGSGERNLLDVYTPASEGPHPVIVYFHPGGWVEGDKSMSLPIWDWTELGYAVVSVNYTFATSPGTIRDAVDDGEAAVRYVVGNGANWNLDTDRVGIFGFSAGGHIAALLSQRSLPITAVGLAGAPTDLVGLLDPTTAFFDGVSGAEVPVLMQQRLGCSSDVGAADDGSPGCEAEAGELSPTEGTAGIAPMLILHGSEDWIVSSSHATALDAAMRAQGADVELVIVSGAGHWPESDALDAFFLRLLPPRNLPAAVVEE